MIVPYAPARRATPDAVPASLPATTRTEAE